jgi:hypothetical protein
VNKQQIIAPLIAILAAIVIVGIPTALTIGRKNRHFYLRARSEEIGRSLIKETNSVFLTAVGEELSSKLLTFLDSTAHVEKVLVEDGSATSQVWLANERREQIVIRLKQDEFDKFSIVGFWFPSSTRAEPH